MSEPQDTEAVEGAGPSPDRSGKPCVFVHTNPRQWTGALVSQYSLKRNSAHADAFDVRIIHTDDHPFLHAREDFFNAHYADPPYDCRSQQ